MWPPPMTIMPSWMGHPADLFERWNGTDSRGGGNHVEKTLDIENSIMQSSSWRDVRMTNFDREDGTTRDDLVQRVALMEEMIAEGRQSTARFGWFFVMWGLVYFAATGWDLFLPFKYWAWPVCVAVAIAVGV